MSLHSLFFFSIVENNVMLMTVSTSYLFIMLRWFDTSIMCLFVLFVLVVSVTQCSSLEFHALLRIK